MIKLVKFAIWMAVLWGTANMYAGEKLSYWFNFPSKSESWTIMLPAPAAGKVFAETMTAIEIEKLICDGKEIVPELIAPAEPPRFRAAEIRDGYVVYQYSLGFIECWSSLFKEGTFYQAKRFTLPTDVKIVEIRYRVRYPDRDLSPTICAKFVASDELVQLIALPK
jgi:hypothetical protein